MSAAAESNLERKGCADHLGRLELVIGPMFAGKSSELLRRLRRHELAGRSVALVKYARDVRYEDEAKQAGRQVITHDCSGRLATAVDRLGDLSGSQTSAQVIGIDEGQFMPDLVEYCSKWSDEGKIVIVAALDATFLRKPFANVTDLIAQAESVHKLAAVCVVCGRDAAFSFRIPGNGDQVEAIGGADMYEARCRRCFVGL